MTCARANAPLAGKGGFTMADAALKMKSAPGCFPTWTLVPRKFLAFARFSLRCECGLAWWVSVA